MSIENKHIDFLVDNLEALTEYERRVIFDLYCQYCGNKKDIHIDKPKKYMRCLLTGGRLTV